MFPLFANQRTTELLAHRFSLCEMGTIATVHRGCPTEIGACPFPIMQIPAPRGEPSYEGF